MQVINPKPTGLPTDMQALQLFLGVDPGYTRLPAGKRIWLVEVQVAQQLRSLDGVSDKLHKYAIGADHAEATEAVARAMAATAPTLTVKKIVVTDMPVVQDPSAHMFAGLICRLDMPAKPTRAGHVFDMDE